MIYYYAKTKLNMGIIKEPEDFVKAWKSFNGYQISDELHDKRRPNWKNMDRIQKAFVMKWGRCFRGIVNPTCWNNLNPENYKQFVDFDIYYE